MRIAIVSDIHGNRTALEAVIEDLRNTAPDLVFHGGDLADSGSDPAGVVDHIRDLGWPGVIGNADEIYTRPTSLHEFARQSSAPSSLWSAIEENAAVTRDLLGEERICWLKSLPRIRFHDSLALVHASPGSLWHSPGVDSTDAQLRTIYAPLDKQLVVFGHIHWPFIRVVDHRLTVANAGSVSLSFDGDPRAAYLLIDDGIPIIRRVNYRLDEETRALGTSGLPHAGWLARTLSAASPQMP